MRLSIPAALVLLILASPVAAWADGFLAAYEDLPLAPGLSEVAGAGMAFDSPSGRIVEAVAQGSARAADVLRFYAVTLPQLGWVRESDLLYRREAELLRLEASPGKGLLSLRFTITPE